MKSLPLNWTLTTFGAVNEFRSSSIDPAEFRNEEFELYSVPSFPTRKPEIVSGSAIGSTKQLVQPDDVLVCKINPRINRVWIVGPVNGRRQIASSEWIVHRAPTASAAYLRHYFSSQGFRDLICDGVTGVGGSLTRAQPKRVATFPIPLAPVAEQWRIADKLNRLLAAVDTCNARLDAVPAVLNRFRQSVLAAATSGELTAEWRTKRKGLESPQVILTEIARRETRALRTRSTSSDEAIAFPEVPLPPSWMWCRVGDIADVQLGGTPSRKEPDYWNGDIPWVSSGEVSNCRIRRTREAISESGLENSNAKIYPRGTVLIAMIGEGKTRGQAAILEIDAATNQNCAGLIPQHAKIEPHYVWYWALGEYERNRNVGRGGNQPALNCARVRSLPVPLPSYEEQQEIVRRVESLFLLADRLAIKVDAVRARMEGLVQSILARAFRGEIVTRQSKRNSRGAQEGEYCTTDLDVAKGAAIKSHE